MLRAACSGGRCSQKIHRRRRFAAHNNTGHSAQIRFIRLRDDDAGRGLRVRNFGDGKLARHSCKAFDPQINSTGKLHIAFGVKAGGQRTLKRQTFDTSYTGGAGHFA